MDSDSDNVAETDKYAFLLGSAIRIEDTDQFFSIYDSILPQDLPDKQVRQSQKQPLLPKFCKSMLVRLPRILL